MLNTLTRTALLLALLLAGCGPRTAPGREVSAPQFWRPAGAEAVTRIEGQLETRRRRTGLNSQPEHEVVILLDGEAALRGMVPRDGPVELTGVAQGTEVSALCAPRMIARATIQVSCIVMVARERAATLSFTAGPRRAPEATGAAQ